MLFQRSALIHLTIVMRRQIHANCACRTISHLHMSEPHFPGTHTYKTGPTSAKICWMSRQDTILTNACHPKHPLSSSPRHNQYESVDHRGTRPPSAPPCRRLRLNRM